MVNDRWLVDRASSEIGPEDIRNPLLRALARQASRADYTGADVLGARCSEDRETEALLLEVRVELGQAERRNDIQLVEPVAIVSATGSVAPQVYPLRADFPQNVPHLNANLPGLPKSLCLYLATPEDLARTIAPPRLLERVRWWMRETAYGRLHGQDQQLDPIFVGAAQAVVVSPDFFNVEGVFYVGSLYSSRPDSPIELQQLLPEEDPRKEGGTGRFVVVKLTTEALPHGQMLNLPRNVCELLSSYAELGVELSNSLRAELRMWPSKEHLKAMLDQPAIICISTPLLRENGSVEGATERAYIAAEATTGALGEALGAFAVANGYAGQLLGQDAPAIDQEALERIALLPLDIRYSFDRSLASQSSGWEERDRDKITLIGAGALGSQIALACARGGFGKWSVIDHDHLLPHNLARHALLRPHMGWPKAETLAAEIMRLLPDEAAEPIVANVLREEEQEKVRDAIHASDLVIDATASVAAARWLSRLDRPNTRALSVFLNPRGSDLVVLREAQNHAVLLDHLEMSYYWNLLHTDELKDHLSTKDVVFNGSCRTPSVQIPQSKIGVLANIAAQHIFENSHHDDAEISLWRLNPDLQIATHSFPAEAYVERELGGWSISVRNGLLDDIGAARRAAGEFETGGIVIGAWDRQNKKIYLVGASDPPPDSRQEKTGFVRGSVGLYREIEDTEARSALNLTYVGEWHTHPTGVTSRPSTDDNILLRWIADSLEYNDAPAIMVIAGEDGVRVRMLADVNLSEFVHCC